MEVVARKNGIVLFNPDRVKVGISAREIMHAYDESDTIKELIASGSWYGTIQRPLDMFRMESFLTIDLNRVAFKIKRIWRDKEKILGDIQIIDTDAGWHLLKMFDMMVFVPRALGHKEESRCILITFDVRPDVMAAKVDKEKSDGI